MPLQKVSQGLNVEQKKLMKDFSITKFISNGRLSRVIFHLSFRIALAYGSGRRTRCGGHSAVLAVSSSFCLRTADRKSFLSVHCVNILQASCVSGCILSLLVNLESIKGYN